MQLPARRPFQANFTLDRLIDRADALNVDQLLPDPASAKPAVNLSSMGPDTFSQVCCNADIEITVVTARKNIEIVMIHAYIIASLSRT